MTVMRVRRTMLGKKIDAVARQLGMNPSVLNRADLGIATLPKKWRQPLAEALGVPVEEICDQNGWPKLIA